MFTHFKHFSTFYIDHVDYEKPKKSKKDKKKRNTKVFSDEESGEDERRTKKDPAGCLDFMKYYKDNVFQNDPLHKQPDQLLKIKNQLHVQA